MLLAGCTLENELETTLVDGFWPEKMSAEDMNCIDLTGSYAVKNILTNQYPVTAGSTLINFPPRLLSMPNSIIKIKQEECSKIEIDYESRFDRRKILTITKAENNLEWNNKKFLFTFIPTKREPDGQSFGREIENQSFASLGKGNDGSLISESRENSLSTLFVFWKSRYKHNFFLRFFPL